MINEKNEFNINKIRMEMLEKMKSDLEKIICAFPPS